MNIDVSKVLIIDRAKGTINRFSFPNRIIYSMYLCTKNITYPDYVIIVGITRIIERSFSVYNFGARFVLISLYHRRTGCVSLLTKLSV